MVKSKIAFTFLIAAELISAAISAESEVQSSDKMANTVAYFMTIESICSRWFDVDKDETKRGAVNLISRGHKLFGAEYFDKKVIEQSILIIKGYDKQGAKNWCSEEMGTTKQMGFNLFR